VSGTERALTDPDESIGATLARLRRASGLSGTEVGRRAGISQAKVSRIETGAVAPTLGDIGRLARALGADEQFVGQLTSRTVIAQRRPTDWSPNPIGLASGQRVIAQREAQVDVIRAFEPTVIHGLLQTGEYARALLSVFQMQEDVVPVQARSAAASVAEALAERIGRQEILTDSRRSFVFVMMETVLDNNFCPAEDMLGQLRRLRELSRQHDNVSIRIVPLSAKPRIPALHGFELFDDKLVAIDTFNTSLTSTGEPDLRLYRNVFDSFEAAATEEIEPIVARYQNHYARRLSS
jgi:transcriptional regulator with XRE-family HTH domain